jgi:hypothetical protein
MSSFLNALTPYLDKQDDHKRRVGEGILSSLNSVETIGKQIILEISTFDLLAKEVENTGGIFTDDDRAGLQAAIVERLTAVAVQFAAATQNEPKRGERLATLFTAVLSVLPPPPEPPAPEPPPEPPAP